MPKIIPILILLCFSFCSVTAKDLPDTTDSPIGHRFVTAWYEGNDDLESFGFDFLEQETVIGNKLGYTVKGPIVLTDLVWYKQTGTWRFSLRGGVNTILILLHKTIGDIKKPTLTTYIMFLPNSELRYRLSERLFIITGFETHYFFFRHEGLDRGILTSLNIGFPIEIGRNGNGNRAFISPFLKSNYFFNFEGANKSYGWTVGVKAILTAKSFFH